MRTTIRLALSGCVALLAACSSHADRTLTLSTLGNVHVSQADFDGDGREDLLLGASDDHSAVKTPLHLLLSNGDGSFRDATGDWIAGEAAAATPTGITADFNGDGWPDVLVLDQGHLERGQANGTTGGFFGEEPFLLLSSTGGKLTVRRELADVYESAVGSRRVHAKKGSVADLDGDGDLDVYVESGGGFPYVRPHFLVNDGHGAFTVSTSGDSAPLTLEDQLLTGPAGAWRYYANALADMDGDGHTDLILGQLRRAQNQQEELRSRVIFNDGHGHFLLSNAADLPVPAFFNGYTYVSSLVVSDLSGDGRPDLVLAHTRGVDDTKPGEPLWTGRYVQVLVNGGGRTFTDESEIRLGDQSKLLAPKSEAGNLNESIVHGLQLIDLDDDGVRDLFFGHSLAPVRSVSPLALLGDAQGHFKPADPERVGGGDEWFGEEAVAMDLNGDRVLDVVHLDTDPGNDGDYNTADDKTRVISTFMDVWKSP